MIYKVGRVVEREGFGEQGIAGVPLPVMPRTNVKTRKKHPYALFAIFDAVLFVRK